MSAKVSKAHFGWQAQHFRRVVIDSTVYHTLLFALSTIHSTLSNLHSTLLALHPTFCAPHCILYTSHATPITSHSALHTLYSTLHTVHCTLHTTCTLHFIEGSLEAKLPTIWTEGKEHSQENAQTGRKSDKRSCRCRKK